MINRVKNGKTIHAGGTPALASGNAVALAQLLEQIGQTSPVEDVRFTVAWQTQKLLDLASSDVQSKLAALSLDFPEYFRPLDQAVLIKRFGEKVATSVTALRALENLVGLQRQVKATASEQLRHLLLALARELDVVIVYLSRCLVQLQQIGAGKIPADEGFILCVGRLLVPLANRLGLGFLKWELEDWVFRLLQPERYRVLAKALDEKRTLREAFIAAMVAKLEVALQEKGIASEVYGRPKHLASIEQKLQRKQLSLDDLHDLRALRVIVPTLEACYQALDCVRDLWQELPEHFDDYVARPKPNGYQSIHTVVLANDIRSLEIQIRTQAMHLAAEYGLAAHWQYKESASSNQTGRSAASSKRSFSKGAHSHEAQIAWMRQLLAWREEMHLAPAAEGLSIESAGLPKPQTGAPSSRLYVLTPEGKVIELPNEATPVDFAYHLHSELGHRCRGAKVNGQLVPLHRRLAQGDVVEIMLAPKNQLDAGPSLDWLGQDPIYLRSSRAKTKVRQWFASLQAESHALPPFELPPEASVSATTGHSATQVAGQIKGSLSAHAMAPIASVATANGQVLVVGVDDLLTRLARCCRPIPPDLIQGYVSLGKGVTVHRHQCASLHRLFHQHPERAISTQWGPEPLGKSVVERRLYAASIEVRANDRDGLLKDVSEVFAKGKWLVREARTLSRKDMAHMRFTLLVAHLDDLRDVIKQVRAVGSVYDVRRIADLGRKAAQTTSSVSI